MRYLIICLCFFVIVGCKEKVAPYTIERFDQQLMGVKSESELQKLLSQNEDITEVLLGSTSEDTALVNGLFHMVQHADARKFYEETLKTFGDLSALEESFGIAFSEIKKLYPEFKSPRVVAAFTGLQNDLVVTDSLVVISLEAFIGPKASYKLDEPQYILRRYAPEYIVPTVVRMLSNQFNTIDFSRETFTTDMIFFGKSLEFSRAVLPHVEDSLIIGYTNREMQMAYENQEVIWAHVLDRELLNQENPAIRAKYFGERPYVGEIGPDCPGRVGQWLGLRVVELYRKENPKVTLQELMANADAEAILRGSKYRGQKD
ncbi:hypothetical protein Lbys_2934 [Leadbetterella byssophila DSM 17132]|uniref:Gliding motility-associated lipoprotein GldB n=1 Tax=Leadbetterella byssophila (strain DSM 17132 / JCM 16389 / KACC 11308 / NBRC 106382 / 4M15) TaxID=649349 RepID=E4RSM6_LEAB4|nr:hypothetical protein [Leadbetterella byssophila]ADQ18596.1 hypothetical protein Lbys_2934 [Leadbetterella byssophila DSM 17132]